MNGEPLEAVAPARNRVENALRFLLPVVVLALGYFAADHRSLLRALDTSPIELWSASNAWLTWLEVDPMLDRLRGEARFEAIRARVFGRGRS